METHRLSKIFYVDKGTKMESMTTVRDAYRPPKSPGVRTKGTRKELLEKIIANHVIRIATGVTSDGPNPENHFCSVTHKTFTAEGFEPLAPTTTREHDYKTEQAVTFWSENYQQMQGATPVRNMDAPFRKSAYFSKPINERLDEKDPPPDL